MMIQRLIAAAAFAALAAGCADFPSCADCESCATSCCATSQDGAAKKDATKGGEAAFFDGKTLTNWKVTEYGGQGDVTLKNGELTVAMGAGLSGIHWTGPALPKTNYEISLEALKVDGDDIFCGICFPAGDVHCSFVCGGWGGQVVGLSTVDGEPANDNETCKLQEFKKDRWYKIRLRVTPKRIETWIDDKPFVNQEIEGHKIDLHPAMESGKPLGIATYATTSKFRNITYKKLQ